MTIGPLEAASIPADETSTPAPTEAGPEVERRVWTPRRRAWRRIRRNWPALIAIGYIALILLLAIFAPLVAPHDPNRLLGPPLEGSSGEYLLGTDDLGRDVLSRLIFGTRVTVQAGFQTAAMALLISVPLGLLSGYVGGKFDLVLQRIMEALGSFPALILALALAAVLGPGLNNAIIAITIVIIPNLQRLVRAKALSVREEVFVEASRSIGTPMIRLLWSRILPGVMSPLIVSSAILVGAAMLAEAGLSFLGLGPEPPQASWGNMLQRGLTYLYTEPMLVFWPGLLIALAVLSFNMLGDGLRDALGISEEAPVKGTRRGRMGLTSVGLNRGKAAKHGVGENGSAPSHEPSATDAVLSVRDLSVEFQTPDGPVTVVEGVTFDIASGEVLGLVGESGSGKSVTSAAIMRLIQTPPGRITTGSVTLEGRDLLSLSFEEMRKLRGTELAMIFQDPMSSLDPAFTVGNQLTEALLLHRSVPKEQAKARAIELLNLVGIPEPVLRFDDYPHQLSGGMRQRVIIAMALMNEPRMLIADEPTTALDVTVQAQIIELLKGLQTRLGMSMLFVTHDMGVIANIADRVAVMYAGQVVEQGPVDEVFERPRHPYTMALLSAIPQLATGGERLQSIPGVVPTPDRFPSGCRFADRCLHVVEACREAPIAMQSFGSHEARCIRSEELVK